MCIHGLPDTHVVDVLLLLRRGGSRRLLLGRQDGCILVLLAQRQEVGLFGAAPALHATLCASGVARAHRGRAARVGAGAPDAHPLARSIPTVAVIAFAIATLVYVERNAMLFIGAFTFTTLEF